MVGPARIRHRGAAIVVAVLAVTAVGTFVAIDASRGTRENPTDVFGVAHGTRPTTLDERSVARVARAFGIKGEVEHVEGGWEAEDDVRSLYLYRTPSAWYGQYTDSSMMLHPIGDRAVICAKADRPPGCALPDVQFLADVAAEPPSAQEAHDVARRVLDAAGVSDDRWQVVVMDASPDVVPCPEEAREGVDCTQQYVPTRAVMLTLDLGHGSTPVRWGLVIGPDGTVLTATGRIAERR